MVAARRYCLARTVLIFGLLAAPWPVRVASAAISKEQLLELIRTSVDEAVVLELVKRDCVDFDLTPEAVLELSSIVPAPVLREAIACRQHSEAAAGVEETPSLSDEPPYTLAQIAVLAIVPATLDGETDNALTSALIEELKRERPRYRLIDPVEMAVHVEDKGFNSATPLKSLLATARDLGAQAVLLATASKFRRIEDPGVRIELKLVESNQGTVLWSGGGQGVSNFFNWQTAKRNAAWKSIRELP
jgi:hypothetical protein